MTQRRGSRPIWLAVLVVLAGVGLAGGAAARRPDDGRATRQPSAVTLTPTAADVAVVPARTEAGPSLGVHRSSGRSLMPVVAPLAALVAVGGLGGPGRSADQPDVDRRSRRARRYAIARRAPPSPQLV